MDHLRPPKRLSRRLVHTVDQMKDQRERGHQRAVLREVRQQDRMVLLGAQSVLQTIIYPDISTRRT